MSDTKSFLNQESILFSPDLPDDHRLHSILRPMVDQTLGPVSQLPPSPVVLWDESRYGLHKSSVFNSLNPDQRNKILECLTELNLSLSYWIEKSGLNYGAKMIMLSEPTETKVAYAIFMGEEAMHFEGFKRFMNFTPDWETHQHPMLAVLARSIEQGRANALTFVIQVLLEGFGMSHYAGLRETCLHEPLRELFTRILRDEARHHGMGLVQCQSNVFSRDDHDQIFELTRDFVRSLQSAHWIKKAVEKTAGPMSATEETRFWSELEFDQVLKNRNQRLGDMILKAGHGQLLEKLKKEAVLY